MSPSSNSVTLLCFNAFDSFCYSHIVCSIGMPYFNSRYPPSSMPFFWDDSHSWPAASRFALAVAPSPRRRTSPPRRARNPDAADDDSRPGQARVSRGHRRGHSTGTELERSFARWHYLGTTSKVSPRRRCHL